jgi:hypothetical protein
MDIPGMIAELREERIVSLLSARFGSRDERGRRCRGRAEVPGPPSLPRISRLLAVRPNGADHQWKEDPLI